MFIVVFFFEFFCWVLTWLIKLCVFLGILQLRKYDVAIQLCEQSQCLAEKNMANSTENVNISSHDSNICVRMWRWSVISKCHFHLGRLEASLNTLEKLHKAVPLNK